MLIEWYPLYAPTAMQLARNRIITGLCTRSRSLAHNPLLSEVLKGLAGVRNPFHPSALLWQSSLLNLPLLYRVLIHPKIKSSGTIADILGFISAFITWSLNLLNAYYLTWLFEYPISTNGQTQTYTYKKQYDYIFTPHTIFSAVHRPCFKPNLVT